ncbi:MAG: class I SAM-dependent methyltransferase [Candidatus Micrarchaeota archaeon]|nr:class I SAM-dependent methyltransferase [Candidatus Micrarchaeota archaeon]
MDDYYLRGEERFGFLLSLGYWLASKMPQVRRFYGFVIDDVKGSGFSDVLDVGTGPGYIPTMLMEAGGFSHIGAVDPSKYMVSIARIRNKNPRIIFTTGSSRKIPFRRKFGLIISTLSFHHWKNRESSLRYLSGFLKKGGEIRIYEFDRDGAKGMGRGLVSPHSVSEREMRGIARKTGMKVKGIARKDGFIRVSLAG